MVGRWRAATLEEGKARRTAEEMSEARQLLQEYEQARQLRKKEEAEAEARVESGLAASRVRQVLREASESRAFVATEAGVVALGLLLAHGAWSGAWPELGLISYATEDTLKTASLSITAGKQQRPEGASERGGHGPD